MLLVEQHPQCGLTVEHEHGSGLVTRYAHALKSLAKVGDRVRRSQPIARVGSSGRSIGSHLHFELVVEGVPQNASSATATLATRSQHQRQAVARRVR